MLSEGEKDFIIFMDSLSNQGIIEFNRERKFVLADKMLEGWFKIKYETNGFYPL